MEHFIALLTDFGAKGQHYIAAMKAVILKINPNLRIFTTSAKTGENIPELIKELFN